MNDPETLRYISGQLRDLASREPAETRRSRYLTLASQCEALAVELKEEQKLGPRLA